MAENLSATASDAPATTQSQNGARIPLQHLSIRVPWHDAGWDGTVCCSPRLNSSCIALNRIGATKVDVKEEPWAGKRLEEVPADDAPPCFAERVNFLSPKAQRRLARHAYSKTSEDHKHICDTPFTHPAYSAAATPYGWLLKERAWGKKWREGEIDSRSLVERYGIDALPEYEPSEPQWLKGRPWIQGHRNQKALLDAFFGALKPTRSLVFAYAKRTPLIDDDQWVIVGVGRITDIKEIQEWDYDPPNHKGIRSYLWERSVCHSIRPSGDSGVLLPYHDLVARCDRDDTLDPRDCLAIVPEEYRREFAYASEHVTPTSAITALLSVKQALTAYNERFGGDWASQFKWLDLRLGELWQLRGPYPGLGAMLSAMGIPYGYQLAYYCWEKAGENGDPWPILGKLVQNPKGLPADLKTQVTGFAETWKYLTGDGAKTRLALAKLMARFSLSLDQALRWWDGAARSEAKLQIADDEIQDTAILKNPYILYECDRMQPEPIAFRTIDQGAFPEKPVANAHPIPDPSRISGPVDGRRLRAATTAILESAADDGHTLLARDEIISRLKAMNLSPTLPATEDQFEIHRERLRPVVLACKLAKDKPAFQLDRLAITRDMIESSVQKRVTKGKRLEVNIDWRQEIDREFKDTSAKPGSLVS